jgi:uncharacterized protein
MKLWRQLQEWGARASVAVLAALVCGMAPEPSRAAGPATPESVGYQSYVTPFPDNDRYRIAVFGDGFGPGVAAALKLAFTADSSADVVDKSVYGVGLARNDGRTWDQVVAEIAKAERFHVAVVVFGTDDQVSLRVDKRRHNIDEAEWQQEYGRRVDLLLKEFKQRRIAVYWVGLPIMRGPIARASSEMMNGIFRQKSVLNGARFIDTWAAFADPSGAYTPYGPDLSGKSRLLRLDNGIHMTDRGYEKLANFVERDIRRDFAAARSEREIPLAGDVTEQQGIAMIAEKAGNSASGSAKASLSKSAPLPDIVADSATVVVPGADASGQPIRVEIVRPAIPGAVVAHLQATPAQGLEIGQTLTADLKGGLTALSSVTLGNVGVDGNKNRLSLTQSPYYKLILKGDALPSKPGRADDFRWPRETGRPSGS